MAILAFQKPEKVIMLESTSSFGKFEFRPLEPGFGMTIGNALRRILLFVGGLCDYDGKGSRCRPRVCRYPWGDGGYDRYYPESQKIRFIRTVDNQDAEKVSVNVAGVTSLTAGYISNYLSFFKVLNPELVICHLAPGTRCRSPLRSVRGAATFPQRRIPPAECEFGTLPIDSIFTPIKNVKYSIENYRVEQKTDYEKLNLEITTDGSIHPKDALKEAAKILIQHFMLFLRREDHAQHGGQQRCRGVRRGRLHMRQLLKTAVGSGSERPCAQLPESGRRRHGGRSGASEPQRPVEVPQLRQEVDGARRAARLAQLEVRNGRIYLQT